MQKKKFSKVACFDMKDARKRATTLQIIIVIEKINRPTVKLAELVV